MTIPESRDRSPASRPGILKVFWPAFLGWGAVVSIAAAGRLGHEFESRLSGTPRALIESVDFWARVLVPVSLVMAICVTVLVRSARNATAVSLNVIAFALLFLALGAMSLS